MQCSLGDQMFRRVKNDETLERRDMTKQLPTMSQIMGLPGTRNATQKTRYLSLKRMGERNESGEGHNKPEPKQTKKAKS